MKFFLDANIPYSSLEIFRKLKLEALHARDVGLGRADDKEIFEYSIKNKSVLITKDLEFGDLSKFHPESYYGVIIFRLPNFLKALQFNSVLENFLNSININDLEKSITIVNLGKYRIKKL